MIKINERAPEFVLPDQDNKIHKLSDYTGKWVLLYFYPKDNTPGCTKEVCSVSEAYLDFNTLKTVTLGVSADSILSHRKFADKYGIKSPLLSDVSREVIQAYDVWQRKTFLGKGFFGIKRTSFLINPDGFVVKIYDKVKPAEHIREVLADLKKLQK